MAGSDKVTNRIDSGRDSTQPTQSVGEAASGETEKSLKEQDAEWGFEPGKGGMATEAKMGMGIVAILVCAFGFLVYHKFDLKQRAMLQAQIEGGSPDVAADRPSPTPAEDAPGHDSGFSSDPDVAEPSIVQPSTVQPTGLAATLQPPPADIDNSLKPAPVTAFPMEPAFASTAADNSATKFDLTEPATDVPDDIVAMNEPEPDFADFAPAVEPSFGAADVVAAPPSRETRTFGASADVESAVTVEPATSPFGSPADPTSLESTPEESVFAAFDAAQQNDKPDAEPSQNIPPAFDEASPFPAFPPTSGDDTGISITESAGRKLPPVEPPAFADFGSSPEVADTTSVPDLQEFAGNEPGPLPADNNDQIAANFEPAGIESADLLPVATADVPTREFDAEPNAVPAFEPAPPPVRKSAPLPDFLIAEVERPSTADADRTDTLVAMTSPTPDVEVFGSQPDAQPPAEQPFPTSIPDNGYSVGTRRFDSTFSIPPQETTADFSSIPIATPTQTVQAPPTFPGFDSAPVTIPAPLKPDSSIPEGVAKFLVPPTIQQVSGTTGNSGICEVKVNDNYWTISKRTYGTARYFSSLALYNRHRIPDPKKLRPGMKVLTPDPKVLEEKYPEFFKDQNRKPKQPMGYFLKADGQPAYRIGERETLSEISQKHLGRASRWIQIYRMNQHILKDPNKLKPGTVIALPDDATSVHLAP